jgi:hypothetical protein
MDVKEIGNNLLDDLGEKYQDSGKHGLFWGIKMYAALGCPPFIVDDTYAKNVFPALGGGAYNGLLEFFKECAAKNIPVTCHGSPQGMTIADAPVYLKEFLKQAPKGSGVTGYTLTISMRLAGETNEKNFIVFMLFYFFDFMYKASG